MTAHVSHKEFDKDGFCVACGLHRKRAFGIEDPCPERRSAFYVEPRVPVSYTQHIEGACGLLAQGVELHDELLASIAISLKRIADSLDVIYRVEASK